MESIFDTYWQFCDANVMCRQLNNTYALIATRCVVGGVIGSLVCTAVHHLVMSVMDRVWCNGIVIFLDLVLFLYVFKLIF